MHERAGGKKALYLDVYKRQDVDWKYAKRVFDEFPKAKKYWDYRKMYEEMGKSIDGVIIATADHTPVSYTHLDVYKRQSEYSATLFSVH